MAELQEDDIYDDTAVGSALDSIKKKFENKPEQVQQSAPKKLNPALKPKPLPKKIPDGKLNLGGGGYLQGVVGNDRIPKVNGSIENTGSSVLEKRDCPVTEKTDQTSSLNTKESAVRIINNALSKRDGVREISSIFKGNDDSSHNIPPKITPKPKPVVRRTSDANNNSKSDIKESERPAEKKMTGTVDKDNCSQSSSQSSPIGLSVHERAKLLANSGNLPNMKPDLASSPRNKGIKPPTSEKPISPAGTGSPKRFNIPKNKSQENVSVELRRVMVDSSDIRKILHRKSVKSVIRKSDDKRFRKVELDSIRDSGNVPVKPDPIYEEIDWEDLEKEFKRTVQEKAGVIRPKSKEASKNFPGIGELEEEQFYDDCGNRVPEERISFIEPMTEEDELGDEDLWRKHGFTGLDNAENLPPPPPEVLENGEIQEEYDDVATIKAENNQRDSGGELYEALPDEPGNEPPPPLPGPKPGEAKLEPPELPPQPPPEPPRPLKDPKEIEKEKKKREKEERERKAQEEREEKEKKREQKKREDELKKLGKNFKISMLDLTKSVGQGTIKSTTTKPAKNNLAVQEGDKVEIIRMADPNPKGKFLVRITESKAVGYVDSSNIELMETGNPDQAAKSSTSSVQEEELDGENYEDADAGGEAEELIEDDVYEEFS